MLFSIIAGLNFSASAYTAHSQSEAVAWANSKIGVQVGSGQCPALIQAYYSYLGVSAQTGNGKDYATNTPPSGWSKIPYYSGFVAQAGDVAVWSATETTLGKTYGHVAIVTSANATYMNIIDQGNSSGNKVRSGSMRYSYGTFYGVIRPDFTSSSTEKPSVYADNDKFEIGRNVTFSFYAQNADSVYLGLYLNGEMYFNGEFSPSATYTRTLTQTGHYAFYIVAHYPSGDVESDWQDFDVYDNLSSFIPTAPTLWVENNRVQAGNDVVIHHWSELAKSYSVSIYKNNQLLINEIYYIGSHTVNYWDPGEYKIVASALNEYGESAYSEAYFTVYNSVPDKPDLWVENNTVQAGSDIIIHHWSELANGYSLSIYKDNQLLVNDYHYTSTYTVNYSESGQYLIAATANNEYGASELAKIYVNVVCKDGTHNYVGVITTPATCTATGVKTYTCSKCGDSYTEIIPKTNHSAVTDNAVAPTCTETGLTEGSHCSVCGKVLVEQTVTPIAAHKQGNAVKENEVAATYEHGGSYDSVVYCTVCGKELSRTAKTTDKLVKNGWVKENNKWYYYKNDIVQTGWVKSGSSWYYMNSSGVMQTGWQKISNVWYYFNASGAMATGWQKVGSTWYYFKSSGAMVTGWQKIGSTWYYFQSSGAMQTGWLKSGGKWYYFESSGAMLANTSRKIGGKTYKFNSSGACTNP